MPRHPLHFSSAGRLFALAATGFALLPFCVHAADKAGAKDFPALSRFKGAEIVEFQALDYDEVLLPVRPVQKDPPPASVLMPVEGKVTSITYQLPANKTPLEAIRNYEQALSGNYKTVFACNGDDCGPAMAGFIGNSGKVIPIGWGHTTFSNDRNRYLLAQRTSPTGDIYVLLYAMQEVNHSTFLFQKTVELKPMQGAQVSVLDAGALQRGLDADGKVAVYGVFFDTGKADVKPESKPSLDAMAKLLANSSALKVYIVGHTDNAGTLASNVDLSQRRADAVVRALTSTYKVDPQRLLARGVASLSPVASNAAEAGRARNRRVELVAQ